jgi:hypothetical protein
MKKTKQHSSGLGGGIRDCRFILGKQRKGGEGGLFLKSALPLFSFSFSFLSTCLKSALVLAGACEQLILLLRSFQIPKNYNLHSLVKLKFALAEAVFLTSQ